MLCRAGTIPRGWVKSNDRVREAVDKPVVLSLMVTATAVRGCLDWAADAVVALVMVLVFRRSDSAAKK